MMNESKLKSRDIFEAQNMPPFFFSLFFGNIEYPRLFLTASVFVIEAVSNQTLIYVTVMSAASSQTAPETVQDVPSPAACT